MLKFVKQILQKEIFSLFFFMKKFYDENFEKLFL